jgi:DNA-binding IscR family transcriptional regulator
MAEAQRPLTSETLAKALKTNPVVIRRVVAGLRDHGYVRSEKGHGGGWTLACDLSKVTLRDIYSALGSPSLLAIGHRTEKPGCAVERAVNGALNDTFQKAEALLLSGLEDITLAMLSDAVRGRLAVRPDAHNMEKLHAS